MQADLMPGPYLLKMPPRAHAGKQFATFIIAAVILTAAPAYDERRFGRAPTGAAE